MIRILVIIGLLVLTGCANAEQQRAQLSASHDRFCSSIGAGRGTPGYADCRLRAMQMAVSERNAAMIAASQPTYQPPPIQQPHFNDPTPTFECCGTRR
jgi:hypothetical protein